VIIDGRYFKKEKIHILINSVPNNQLWEFEIYDAHNFDDEIML